MFACRHALASSFLLLRVQVSGLQMMKYFSIIHKLHFFPIFEYEFARAKFETKMTNMIHNIEFRKPRPSEFQCKLSEHTEAINKDPNLYIPADKTTNFYRMTTDNYKSLLKKSIEKEYKKAPVDTASEINNQAKDIARNLNLSGRIETLAQNEAFITLKDHKDNFPNNPTCRLINPTKSEIGKVSKCILDRINKDIINKTGGNNGRAPKTL